MGVPLSDLLDPSARAALAAIASGEEVSAEPSLADAAIRDARSLDVKVVEAELEGKAMTHESLDRSPKHNWVEDAGGLPAYIEHIAKDIAEKRGVPLSRAIPIAIGAVKRWARGGGDVNADTRAKAAAAVAEWEKLKATNAAKSAAKATKAHGGDDLEVKAAMETKGDEPTGEMEHKSATPGTAVLSTDDETGVVEAIVSVTGIADRVDDIIEPGAYASTLANHEPIGVWSHDDKTWVARAEEVKELPPGDPSLPKVLNNGQPWPKEAGALYVKSRFNLETPHGAAAYSDVKFFKGKTGWSIGYRVTNSKRDVRTGVRRIKSLNLYEFSPVMVGAAPQSMTLSVKSLSQPVDADEVPDAPETLGADEVKALFAAREALESKGRFVEALHPRNAGKFASKPGAGAAVHPTTSDVLHGGIPASTGSVAPMFDVGQLPMFSGALPDELKANAGKHIRALKAAQIEAVTTLAAAEVFAHLAESHELFAHAGMTTNFSTTLGMAAVFALHKSIKHGKGESESKADPAATASDAAPDDGAGEMDDSTAQALSLLVDDEIKNLPDDAVLDDETWSALINAAVQRLGQAVGEMSSSDGATTTDAPPAAPAADAETKDLFANLEAKAHWTDNLGGSKSGAEKKGKLAQPSPAETAALGKATALADQMNAKARDHFRKGTSGRLDSTAREAHAALGEGLLDGEQILRAGGGPAELGAAAAKAKVDGRHPMHVEALLAAAADHHESTEEMDDDELNTISAAPDLFPHEKQMIDQARTLPPAERRSKLREMAGLKSFVDELEEKAGRFVRTNAGVERFGKVIGSQIGSVSPVGGDHDLPVRPDENSDEVQEHAHDLGISNEAAADHLHQLALEAHAATRTSPLAGQSAESLWSRRGARDSTHDWRVATRNNVADWELIPPTEARPGDYVISKGDEYSGGPEQGYVSRARRDEYVSTMGAGPDGTLAVVGSSVHSSVHHSQILEVRRNPDPAAFDTATAKAAAAKESTIKAQIAALPKERFEALVELARHGSQLHKDELDAPVGVTSAAYRNWLLDRDEQGYGRGSDISSLATHAVGRGADPDEVEAFLRSARRGIKGFAFGEEGFDLEGKDVFTSSAPAQTTSGFGGGKSQHVVTGSTLATARPKCPACGSKSVTMIGGRHCAMCGTPVGKPAPVGEPASKVDQKADGDVLNLEYADDLLELKVWSDAARAAALAARRAHGGGETPEREFLRNKAGSRGQKLAIDLEPGDHVNFTKPGPGGMSDPKTVAGPVDDVEIHEGGVRVKVNGETHKLTHHSPVTVELGTHQFSDADKAKIRARFAKMTKADPERLDEKTWSPASRIAALAARRAHHHAAPEPAAHREHQGPRLVTPEMHIEGHDESPEESAAKGAAAHERHTVAGKDYGDVRVTKHEGTNLHEARASNGTILSLHASPESAHAFATAYNEARKKRSLVGAKADQEPLELKSGGAVRISEHEILAASRLRLLVD